MHFGIKKTPGRSYHVYGTGSQVRAILVIRSLSSLSLSLCPSREGGGEEEKLRNYSIEEERVYIYSLWWPASGGDGISIVVRMTG